MAQGSHAMYARNHPWTAVDLRRIVESDPAGQIALRLEIRVAVILMPWERLRLLELLVHSLIPVETNVGAEQIGGNVAEHGTSAERTQEARSSDQMNAEGDRLGIRDEETPISLASQKCIDLRFDRIDFSDDLGERTGIKCIGQNEEAELVIGPHLLGGESTKRAAVILPRERLVPGMAFNFHRCGGRGPDCFFASACASAGAFICHASCRTDLPVSIRRP